MKADLTDYYNLNYESSACYYMDYLSITLSLLNLIMCSQSEEEEEKAALARLNSLLINSMQEVSLLFHLHEKNSRTKLTPEERKNMQNFSQRG